MQKLSDVGKRKMRIQVFNVRNLFILCGKSLCMKRNEIPNFLF